MGRPKKSLKSRKQYHSDEDYSIYKQRGPLNKKDTFGTTIQVGDKIQDPDIPSPEQTQPRGATLSACGQRSGNEEKSSDWRGSDEVEPNSINGDVKQQPSVQQQALKSSACDQCYRFKVKCTRELDCCQRCSTNGNACTYSAAVETERPRKRQASQVLMESSVKRMTLTTESKPSQVDPRKFITLSTSPTYPTASDQDLRLGRMFCPSEVTSNIHPNIPNMMLSNTGGSLKAVLETSSSQAQHQASMIPSNQPSTTSDNPPFYDTMQFYGDRLLPQSLEFMPGSDNDTLDLNFIFDEEEKPNQSTDSELSSEHLSLEPNYNNMNKSVPSSCACLQSMTITLSTLQGILLHKITSSSDSLFAAARGGLSLCKSMTLAQCKFCQPSSTSVLTMLCLAILQHVDSIYQVLEQPKQHFADESGTPGTKIAFSIKLGAMEFTANTGHDSSILSFILKMEKAQAAAVCVELEKMVIGDASTDVPSPIKGDKMVQDGLISLIRAYRERFGNAT